jgi:hypothetical protein
MTKRDFYIDGRWTAPASARDAQVSHASTCSAQAAAACAD